MTIPNLEKVTSAFIALLDANVTPPVGDHGTDGLDTSGSYHTVYAIDGGSVSGSFGDPHESVTLVLQVNSIGRSRQQAQGLAWIAANVILEMSPSGGHVHPLAGPGWRGDLRTQQTFDAPHNEGTDDTGQEVWAVRERYEVAVHRA